MRTKTVQLSRAAWPAYRVVWERPSRRGSDDWEKVIVGQPIVPPRWPMTDWSTALLVVASIAVTFLACYGLISLVQNVVGK